MTCRVSEQPAHQIPPHPPGENACRAFRRHKQVFPSRPRQVNTFILALFLSAASLLGGVTYRGGENPAFLVDGEPHFVKGVTFGPKPRHGEIDHYMQELKLLGVNTIRTWGCGEDTWILMDAAQRRGIKVVLGLWLRHGKSGAEGDDNFNYITDTEGKKEQGASITKWVKTFRNHPALLCWGVGNEVILNINTEEEKIAYAQFLEQACAAIKKLDPNHPVMSASGWTLAWPYWKQYCPSIDIYGINTYGPGAGAIHSELERLGINKPYLLTEFGPRGEWDAPTDRNGLKIEPSDTEKYDQIANGWHEWIEGKPNCLGGFVFNFDAGWDHGAIWLSTKMRGYFRPAYWALREAFTGQPPDNMHPLVFKLELPRDKAPAGTWLPVTLKAGDPEKDNLDIYFMYNQREGSREKRDRISRVESRGNLNDGFEIQVPNEQGLVKLYAFVADSEQNLTVAHTSLVADKPVAVNTAADQESPSADTPASEPGERKVEIVGNVTDGFKLLRNGEPYLIKGAGGSAYLKELVEHGGNSVRTWGIDQMDAWVGGERWSDYCHRLGISIAGGIWLGHVRHGFDYSNPEHLEEQREKVRNAVEKYKDHPALIIWSLGNEMEMHAPEDQQPLIWKEVEYLAQMVKKMDPSRPVMTVVAGIFPEKARTIQKLCPSIDILGVNAYSSAGGVGGTLANAGWDKPYILTEFGLSGPWEVTHTSWDAPIEPMGREKAADYYANYSLNMEHDNICIGSYCFVWGSKQEATASWFGMFLPTGEKTPTVDAMSKCWTGEWPSNRAPIVKTFESPVKLKKVDGGKTYTAEILAVDKNDDALSFEWNIIAESTDRRAGGDHETAPPAYPELIKSQDNDGSATFTTPTISGAYRLFVTVKDGKGGACIENIPFYVN